MGSVGGWLEDAWHSATGFLGDAWDDISEWTSDVVEFAIDISLAPLEWLGDLLIPDFPDSPTYSSTTDRIGNTIKEGIFVARCYGKCKIGGNKIRFNAATDSDLRIIVGHCFGPIEGITRLEVNDIEWSELTGSHTKTEYTGTRTQTIDARFSSNASPYRSIAYTAFTFVKNDKQVGYNPNITAVTEGLLCAPLAGGADVFTRNPAVILYDWYLNVEGYSTGDLDLDAFKSLEELCDEVPSGGTLPRYRFDFNIDVNMPINDAKKLIWQSFNGRTIMSQGKIKPIWDSAQMADGSGSLTAKTVSHAFDFDNIVKGSLSWNKFERPNLVRVHFKDSGKNYNTSSVYESDDGDIEDNGEILFEEKAWYITDDEIARRRAKFKYNRKRYPDYAAKLTALSGASDLEILDLVTATHTLPGWTTKQFLIVGRSEDELGRMQFNLEAYFSGSYDDAEVGDQSNFESNLPNPYQVSAASTAISAIMTAVGTVYDFDAVRVTFTPPATDPFYSHSEIYASNDDSTYYFVGQNGTGEFTFNALGAIYEPGDTCYIKLINVTEMGVKGAMPGSLDTSVAVTSTMRLAGFYAGTNDFWGGNVALGNAGTKIVLGDLDGTPKIALGGTADSLTLINASTYPGFFADGNGYFRAGGTDGEVSWDGTTLNVKGNFHIDSLPAFPFDDGLVGYWAFDDISGSVAVDSSGNGNNGTITGTSWTDGVSGGALTFAGGSDIVSFSEITLPHGSWGISFWMIQDTDIRMSIGKNGDANNRFYHVNSTLTTAYLRIHLNDGDYVDLTFGEIMQDTGWRHVVVTADGDTMSLYLDGNLVDSDTELTNEFRVNCIGNPYTGTTHTWEGELCGVRLYNETPSVQEVKSLYLYPSGNKSLKTSGNQLTTGAIQSTNWGPYTGMQIDLDNAEITIRESEGLTIASGADILFEHGGDIKFTSVTAPGACTATLVVTGTGNVDNGTHSYKITHVNNAGETELGTISNVVTVDATHKQVDLTSIPISSSSSVTARKIYRTKAGGAFYYLLTTISNNTGTTYTDNIADSSLTGTLYNFKSNNTFGKIFIDAIVVFSVGTSNVLIGKETGGDILNGYGNTACGFNGLYSLTTGYGNTAFGFDSLYSNITGHSNIALGYFAGKYETGSNAFYINNQDRTNTAGDKLESLLYGVMAADPDDQTLTINATETIQQTNDSTSVSVDGLILHNPTTAGYYPPSILFTQANSTGSPTLSERKVRITAALDELLITSTVDDWTTPVTLAHFTDTHVTFPATIQFKEVASSPGTKTDYGQIYTKSDNLLYFKDGAGTEYYVDITAV